MLVADQSAMQTSRRSVEEVAVEAGKQIERVMRRTWRYWYEDGLAEMATGILFVALGLLFLVESLLPVTPFSGLAAYALPIVVVGGVLLANRLVAVAKARITYPRTGYVTYRRGGGLRRRLVTGIVGGIVAGVGTTLLATVPASHAWIPQLQGLLIGAAWLILGHTVGVGRFYALAVISALIGAAASLAAVGELLGTSIYFGGMGLAMVGSGAAALWAYLRQTRPGAEGQDDGG